MKFTSGPPILPEYGSGYASLDRDHAPLIQILNELKASPNAPPSVLNELRLRFLAYLDAHFEHQENLMDEFRYSQTAAHKSSHREIRKQADSLVAAIATDSPGAISACVTALEDWIEIHQRDADREL